MCGTAVRLCSIPGEFELKHSKFPKRECKKYTLFFSCNLFVKSELLFIFLTRENV